MHDETQDRLICDALQHLLERACTPAHVRAIEASPRGPEAQGLWQALEDSGLLDAMLPEDSQTPDGPSGAGLALPQMFELFELLGRHAAALPVAQTMLARGLMAHRHAPASATIPFRFDEVIGWQQALPDLPSEQQLLLAACVDAALLSGAMQTVLTMSLQYANQREQFGWPIGKFQAIQHQLAVMAEHAMAAQMAARLACAGVAADGLPDAQRVAVAKARCAEAALEVAASAHAVHGAIGFTAAFDLQICTRRLYLWRQRSGTESYWQRQLGRSLLCGTWSATPLSLDVVRVLTD
jgi:acyl-CoA dehydrogenase